MDTHKLAIDGGNPIRTAPLPPWPAHSQREIHEAVSVLKSGRVNYWTGDQGKRFESEFAAYHGVKYGIALANGTLALELSLRVLGIGAGDEVIVTPRSYFASVSCIVLAGATPIFADVDSESQNVTAETVARCISPRTKAIILVHLAGWPCDMPSLMALARERNLKVVEDCAQAHGARINGQAIGSFGDIGAFSFCQDKIMSTAGEGGMFITNDRELWEAGWSYKDHGKSFKRVHADDHPPGFRWLHDGFGSNWRMTEIQAAIGRTQLSLLDEWVLTRRENALQLADGLMDLDCLRVPLPNESTYHSYYKFYVFLRPDRLRAGWSRDTVLAALTAEGVPGLSGSCPEIYQEKAFAGKPYERLPVAAELGETSLMFLVHPTLTNSDMTDMLRATVKVLREASL